MKMLKSKKALSPVVASIILVAVTVAVSLAVAVWMGALTGGFMSSGEKIKVGTPYGWTDNSVTVYVINDGGTTVKIIAAKVQGGPSGTNYVDEYIDVDPDVEIAPKAGAEITITLTGKSFTSGYEYTIKLISSANNEYPTTGTKP
jgi:flagellin-like protein